MRKCSYCLLKVLSKRALAAGEIVTVRDDPLEAFPDGKEVFKHPGHIQTPEAHGSVYFQFWVAEIPEECEC